MCLKDITQQHLCDPVAVSLVEKCARFHIFCSEALCEEDVAVFDPKINNENLTKCLQTLKEMYHDLHVRQNVTCLENEAEFCMYMVLMNLNKGDILRFVYHFHVLCFSTFDDYCCNTQTSFRLQCKSARLTQ